MKRLAEAQAISGFLSGKFENLLHSNISDRTSAWLLGDNTLTTKIIKKLCEQAGYNVTVFTISSSFSENFFGRLSYSETPDIIMINCNISDALQISKSILSWEKTRFSYYNDFTQIYGSSFMDALKLRGEIPIVGVRLSLTGYENTFVEKMVTLKEFRLYSNEVKYRRSRYFDSFGKLRILVVDDSIVSLKIISRALSKTGHQVDILQRSEEVSSRINSTKYDVVLMDINMPVINGLEATKDIREREYSTESYVSSLSTYIGEHNRIYSNSHQLIIGISTTCGNESLALSAGMDAFFSKTEIQKALSKQYSAPQ
jgi:CheY-like chemotaxis protein